MKKSFYIVLFFFISNYLVLAQTSASIVCQEVASTGLGSSSYGMYKPAQTPSGEYFRVLIAYAQFSSDTQTNTDWPLNQLPNWANNIIASSVSSSYPSLTLSDYFQQASCGKLNFIGDVYPNLIVIPSDMSYGNANQYVIGQLNSNISDFTKYDNWGVSSGNYVFNPGSGDGYIDMIIIIYRNAGSYFGVAGGIATLNLPSLYTTHDGLKITSGSSLTQTSGGITTRAGLSGQVVMVEHLAHEFGHYLFGYGHSNFGGLMAGDPDPYETETYMMNAWEREWLGYITPTMPTSDGQQITIGDFVSSGDAIKIPIPFNDPTSSTFFLIENHQRASIYDQIMRGGSLNGQWNLTTSLGKGVYVWLIKSGNTWPPTIDIKSADGAWDWQYVNDYYAGPGWYDGTPYAGYLPETIRSAVDRNSGRSDRYPDNILWHNWRWASKWVDINRATGSYEITRNVMGDVDDAYNIGYNDLLTPWSNPSSYVDGTTNISVQLVSQNGNNVTLKIYSTSSSALALAPSKPQFLKVVSQSNHPYLTWDANLESDVTGYYIYRSENGAAFQTLGYTTQTNYTDLEVTTHLAIDRYDYKIKAVDSQSKYSLDSDTATIHGVIPKIGVNNASNVDIPKSISITQNYPNPFNPTTTVNYQLPVKGLVSLKVYDLLGRQIAVLDSGVREPGKYSSTFNADNLPSGIYICRLTVKQFDGSKDFIAVRKLTLLK